MTKKKTIDTLDVLNIAECLEKVHFELSKKVYNFIYDHKLTISQFKVLQALMSTDEMNQKALSEFIYKTTGNMVTVLDSLEKKDFIKRTQNIHDRRNNVIELTKKGKNKFLQIEPDYNKNILLFEEKISKQQKEKLKHILRLLIK